MVDQASRWHPAEGIDSPCADISFAYKGTNSLAVTMHFSRVVDRPNRDLVLWFKSAIALRWTTESLEMSSYADPLPKCSSDRWSSWTYPLIRVRNSTWLREHASRDPVESQGREHYLLVSMNDVCELLALFVAAAWINGDADG